MVGQLIEKEQIGNYRIIPAEINRKNELRDKLIAARRLGNEFKSKVGIAVQTEDGVKRIETTIWLLTDDYIQIKNGVVIPLKSIVDIDF